MNSNFPAFIQKVREIQIQRMNCEVNVTIFLHFLGFRNFKIKSMKFCEYLDVQSQDSIKKY